MEVPLQSPDEQPNVYFNDPESGAEMARLIAQDQVITRGMGGLFSERANLAGVHTILDLACGPGGWTLDVASLYPHIQIVGIDISQAMIAYARAQVQVQRLKNIRFHVMDILQPLKFPDASFDMINARLIGFLPPLYWPKLLKECWRLLKPGGTIRLTEMESPITTSPALQRLQLYFTRALKTAGQSFSPDGELVGTMAVLSCLLRTTGFRAVQMKAHAIEWSAHTNAHDEFYHNFMVGFKLAQKFQTRMNVAPLEDLNRLHEQLVVELQADDFCAVSLYLTVWGEKRV
jgi:SAM-dependent methyltransferase